MYPFQTNVHVFIQKISDPDQEIRDFPKFFNSLVLWGKMFRNLGPDFLICPQLVVTWGRNIFRNLAPDFFMSLESPRRGALA